MPGYSNYQDAGALRYRRRRTIPGRLIWLLVLLVLLVGLGWGVYSFIKANPLDNSLQVKVLRAGEAWVPLGSGIVSMDGYTMSALDDQGIVLWNLTLPLTGTLQVSADHQLIGIHNQQSFALINPSGDLLYYQDFPTGIERFQTGSTMVALQSQDADGRFIQVYKNDATAVETLRFPLRRILDYGFYQGDQLWVLLMDDNAVSPSCRVSTYNPGVSLTGMIFVPNQLVYKVLVTAQKEVVAIGSQSVVCYDAVGKRQEELSITGWTIQDAWVNGADIWLLLAQSKEYEDFSILRSIRLTAKTAKNTTEVYYDISDEILTLPVAAHKIRGSINGNRLYILNEGGLDVMKGKKLEQSLPMDRAADMFINMDRRLLYIPYTGGVARMGLPK